MSDRARHSRPRVDRRVVRLLAGASVLLLLGGTQALADHSLGNACTVCHSLRSASVKPGTRNLKDSLISQIFFYGPDNGGTAGFREDAWYCAGSTTDPRAKSDGVFVGGDPLDCSYCHKQALNDIGSEIGNASDSVGGSASAHPVDTRASTRSWGAVRIACNQCHDADVAPQDLCTKGTGTGYPNHKNMSAVTAETGINERIDTTTVRAAHLLGGTTAYGPTADWTGLTNILCFNCHKPGGLSSKDIQTDYGKTNGGHNIISSNFKVPAVQIGSLAGKKLPCYDCHDPHGVQTNKKLIIETKSKVAPGKQNPYGTSYVTGAPPIGFTGANDRIVCAGCHGGAYTVEAVTLPNVLSGWTPAAFPFHAGAHTAKDGSDPWQPATGNCLQKNGGCHQSPHNTDVFRCLDCHSKAVTDAMTSRGVSVPARLLAVNHIDSEFAHIGDIGPTVNSSTANNIQSVHSIPYKAKVFTILKTTAELVESTPVDMSTASDNGCLYCHYTVGAAAGSILKDADGNYYAGLDPGTRESLDYYNQFCLSCHDGNGPTFTVSAAYTLVDGDGSTVSHTGGIYFPPKVNNPSSDANPSTTAWKNGYYFSSGHGRGTSGTTTNKYSPSNNTAAKIPCLECHVYHGSTSFKLLPGWRETTDARGHVVKGKSYTPVTVDTKFSIGGVSDSTKIDYIDYTDNGKNTRLTQSNFFSNYVSDYLTDAPWTSDESGTTVSKVPTGTFTSFGTSGDMAKGNTNSVGSGRDATTASKIGFCNTCHFFENSTDGTVETAGFAYTHEGQVGATDSDNQPLKSTATFFKDCCECHDPHGSGGGGAGDTSDENIYMISRRIRHALKTSKATTTTSDWSAVVFKSLTAADSFDEDDTNNQDDLCAVCHQSAVENANTNVDHNYRSWTGTPTSGKHQEGNNCLQCHPHGEK